MHSSLRFTTDRSPAEARSQGERARYYGGSARGTVRPLSAAAAAGPAEPPGACVPEVRLSWERRAPPGARGPLHPCEGEGSPRVPGPCCLRTPSSTQNAGLMTLEKWSSCLSAQPQAPGSRATRPREDFQKTGLHPATSTAPPKSYFLGFFKKKKKKTITKERATSQVW